MSHATDKPSNETDTAVVPDGGPVESALRTLLDLYGPRLIFEPTRLRTFLEQRCPDARHDVSSLLTGITAQVPQTLLGSHEDAEPGERVRALEKKLRDEHAMNRYAAAWTVRTWADALDLAPPATSRAELARGAASTAGGGDAPVPDPAIAHSTAQPTTTNRPSTGAAPPVEAGSPTPARPASAPPLLQRTWIRGGLAAAFVVAAVMVFRYVDRPPQDGSPSSTSLAVRDHAAAGRSDPIASTGTKTTQAVVVDPELAKRPAAPVAPAEPAPDAMTAPAPAMGSAREPQEAIARPLAPEPDGRSRPPAVVVPATPPPRGTAPLCRPVTCGTVVGVHAVATEPDALVARVDDALGLHIDRRPEQGGKRPAGSADRRYEVVVRFDDRDVRVLRSARLFEVGTRVRTAGRDDLVRIARE